MRFNRDQRSRRKFSRDSGSGQRQRKGSNSNENRGRERRGEQDSNPRFKRRIHKERDESNRQGRRNNKRSLRKMRNERKKKEPQSADDLNKQLNEYWIKSGATSKITGIFRCYLDNKLAQDKLNDELDNYWKKKEEDKPKAA